VIITDRQCSPVARRYRVDGPGVGAAGVIPASLPRLPAALAAAGALCLHTATPRAARTGDVGTIVNAHRATAVLVACGLLQRDTGLARAPCAGLPLAQAPLPVAATKTLSGDASASAAAAAGLAVLKMSSETPRPGLDPPPSMTA
jgi:hypothetical protein